jgi:hypothetical protein
MQGPSWHHRSHRASHPRRAWLRSVLFTGGLLGLIAVSIERVNSSLLLAMLGSVTGLVLAFHYAFPGGTFFSFRAVQSGRRLRLLHRKLLRQRY